jgi:hypothetical protein
MYETACLSTLLDRHEDIKKSGDFLKWLRGEVERDNKEDVQELIDLLLTSDLTPDQFAELYGLFRHWGHPTVHEELGCEKTRVIGSTRSYPKCSVQRKMVGLMNRQFYVSFVSKKWTATRNS